MKKPLAAVLGCGPSGLLAAHAFAMKDVPFVILSPYMKSKLGGAQFSHIPIPGIHEEEDKVLLKYIVTGDAETYHKKVYGNQQVDFVSFSNVENGMEVPAWSLTEMYDQLWTKYQERIVDFQVEPSRIQGLLMTFDLVISSAPADKMCLGTIDPSVQHQFRSQTIRILNDALDQSTPDNTIVYDGTDIHSYYRMSRIFGVGSTEWSSFAAVPPGHDLRTVNKPLWTNCDCHIGKYADPTGVPFGIIRVGRFGCWSKGKLSYHAYNEVTEVLARWGIE
jgi:hypothetical protein